MNKIDFVMSAKELNTAVERAIYDAKNQRKVLHRIGVACLLHAHMHGDTRPVTRFATGLKEAGRHIRANALFKWVETYSPLHWDNKEKRFRKVNGKEWDVDAAIRDPFYSDNRKGTQEGTEYDPEKDQKNVVAFLKKHKKMAEENGATETAAKYAAMIQAASA